MRKSTIWLLVGVMVFTFIGLLYLHVNVVLIIMKTQSEQFDDAVKRSLYQVSHDLELDATETFLNEQMLSLDMTQRRNPRIPSTLIARSKITVSAGNKFSSGVDLNILEESIILQKQSQGIGQGDLESSSQTFMEALQDRYFYERGIVEEVIQKKIKASNQPLHKRIDFKRLESFIRLELINNELELPFEFAVFDGKRNLVYSTADYSESNEKDIYTQVLFPKDPPSRLYTLKVVFPSRSKVLFRSVKVVAPSIAFSLVLLVIFTITIYIVLRQKRLSEMKKDFISNMTHELKTPVASISIAGQMLSDESMIETLEKGGSLKNSGAFNKITRTIVDETKRLHFLIDKVLQMSLVEDGHSILKLKEVDVNDTLLNVVQIFDLQVEKSGGKMEIELEALESTVMVDEMHFTNVLFNLMENAVKYRRRDVPLLLTATTSNPTPDMVKITIEDNGVGMKKEDLKKVFERFYRVSTGNVHNVKGFGLGLAYVKKIINDLDGTIKVESELNVGTKFIITLPLLKR